jgi:hypothetical protein
MGSNSIEKPDKTLKKEPKRELNISALEGRLVQLTVVYASDCLPLSRRMLAFNGVGCDGVERFSEWKTIIPWLCCQQLCHLHTVDRVRHQGPKYHESTFTFCRICIYNLTESHRFPSCNDGSQI